MIKKGTFTHLCLLLLLISSCKKDVKTSQDSSMSKKETWVQMFVEIPAGTIEKYELNKKTNQLTIDSIGGQPRLINYLGYPANYGMIPKTILPKEKGGDGDPLDIIAIGPPAQRGALIDCKIIGVLKLVDSGEQDDKLIAITKNSSLNHVNSLKQLKSHYPGILEIIETWFTNYKGKGKMKSNGFLEKDFAEKTYQLAEKEFVKLN